MAPKHPKVYHITHVDNLPGIAEMGLWSDADRIRQKFDCRVVGMSEIKRRRLEELSVSCHPGTKVGEYVPFYLCPRSIMLFLLHRGNHPDLTYQGGQRPIVHLEADLTRVVGWAENEGRRWALSNGNAGSRYARFLKDWKEVESLDWDAIMATDWRDPIVKERKQSEFLVECSVPWTLIERIGVIDSKMAENVTGALSQAAYAPEVIVASNWYY